MDRNARLNGTDFLICGLKVLAADGHRALTAARVARELCVTTGSFYWHFRTIDQFREKLKKFWRDEIVVGTIVAAKERAEAPGKVLEEIGKIVAEGRLDRFDSAMRVWSESDEEARKVVEAADAIRQDTIVRSMKGAGASQNDAEDRMKLFGAAWRGSRGLYDTDDRLRLIGLITRDLNS